MDVDTSRIDVELSWIKGAIAELQADAKNREEARSESNRRILERLDDVSKKLEAQTGFINGALFTVKTFYALAGAAIAGLVGYLTTGHTPFK